MSTDPPALIRPEDEPALTFDPTRPAAPHRPGPAPGDGPVIGATTEPGLTFNADRPDRREGIA